eukprot:CAMPEP_0170577994 /NCGR_PEP_ID=MMETSP0224-20130122/5223_1 /TAXON_ID=285029 /ORGANISM="Togula jolla, Strain CCCM 725" /LENGTH=103 /DNA_ID=CAMNT_0010900941 /DNA_START=97 /DNA_END=407 /DNA_ORIENTATION=+
MLPAPSLKAAFVEAPGEPKFRCLPPAAVTEQCGVPGVDDFGDGKLAAAEAPEAATVVLRPKILSNCGAGPGIEAMYTVWKRTTWRLVRANRFPRVRSPAGEAG